MNIIYENRNLIVVYKEPGVPVQTSSFRTKDLVSMLKGYLFEQHPEKGEPYLALIHRLDQPVGGLLVFAKTPEAGRHLSAQLGDGRMEKWYMAKVHVDKDRALLSGKGTLVDYLLKDPRTNTSKVVSSDVKGAKKAELTFEALSEDTLRIKLRTGRHHQIRVQLSNAGYPLVGDHKYGREDEYKYPCLCAYHLSFIAPGSGKRLTFELTDDQIGF